MCRLDTNPRIVAERYVVRIPVLDTYLWNRANFLLAH